MSVRQGNEIGSFLEKAGLRWNRAWEGGPVVASGDASAKALPGGLHITVLSPRRPELERLAKHWGEQLERAGPDRPKAQKSEDEAVPAGTSASVVVLYAARDVKWYEQIKRHVQQSESGATWEFLVVEGARQLQAARLTRLRRMISLEAQVLVLVSAHTLASRAFTQQVLPVLEDASESGRRFASWALLEPCEWQRLPLSQSQAMTDVRKPLSQLSSAELEQTLGTIIEKVAALATRVPAPPAPAAKSSSVFNVEALANAAFSEDTGIANAASIAFLAEFNDKAVLVGGDARSDVLCDSIRSLLSQRKQSRLRLDAFVIPHGGSQRNLSRELLELLECDRYLVSTNGAVFQPPNRETIARIITFGRATPDAPLTLVFNYRSQITDVWANPELQARYRYTAIYPQQPDAGIKVQI
jgi:hypothetical protein